MLPRKELQNTQTEQPILLPVIPDEMPFYLTGGSGTTLILTLAYSLSILKVVTPLLTRIVSLFEDDEKEDK